MQTKPTVPSLGIDFCGGIVPPEASKNPELIDPKECEDLGVSPRCGSIEALQQLVPAFDGNVWLFCRMPHSMGLCLRHWLASHDFWRRTEIPATHLLFCENREEKIAVCRHQQVTHYVDDCLPVLEALRDDIPFLYLMPEEALESPPNPVRLLECWDQAVPVILGDLKVLKR